LPTLSIVLRDAAQQLERGPHRERARRDAETLLEYVLGVSKAWLIAHGDDELLPAQSLRYAQAIERRLVGEPIQYITGHTEFYGLPFRVTPDVLIPRPETEHLVEKALELATAFERPRILDIGTGSGALAVALAHQLPHAQITAIDISTPALAIARENAVQNKVVARIRFVQSDLLGFITNETYNLIVSNPPYVPLTDRSLLSVEVREHEPVLALFAGNDGLDVCRHLIPAAFAVLEPGGFLAVEIGFGQSEQVAQLLASSGFEEIEFAPDLQSIPRVASARRPAGSLTPHS
jgi:release factor glutamine methyltransferase